MSEIVHYSGELELIQTIGPADLELSAKIALEENNIVKSASYDTYLECLRDNLSDKYVVAKDNLFKIIQKKRVDDDDEFFHSTFLENGNIGDIDLNSSTVLVKNFLKTIQTISNINIQLV